MTFAGSSGVLRMILGVMKRGFIVRYCAVGVVNANPTYMVRQMVHGGREARNSSISRCVNA